MNTPIIETKRTILKPLYITDADEVYDRWTSDERVARYMRWTKHNSIEETREWLLMEEDNISNDKVYGWGFRLKDSDYLFGSGGLCFNEEFGQYELGYNIMYKFWNQGYTTEIAKAMIKFAKEELGVDKLVACYADENLASGAVLRKCGFVYEKDVEQYKFDGKTLMKSKLYSTKSPTT